MTDDNLKPTDIVDLLPLDEDTTAIANKIVNEKQLEKVQDLTHLFNLNQAKKNVLRIMKLNGLLDRVSDQMIERFEKRPGEFSNSDLLNYMQVTQSAIDRAQKQLNLVDDSPAIQLNQQVNVNIDGNVLDKDSRTRIAETVTKILQRAKDMNLDLSNEPDVIQTALISDDTSEQNTGISDNKSQYTKLLDDEEE